MTPRSALPVSLAVALLAAAGGASASLAQQAQPAKKGAKPPAAPAPVADASGLPPFFVERPDCGVDFVHRRFMTEGRKYLNETAGAGVGLFDFDGDGLLDVYCVQSCPLPGWTGDPTPPPDCIYRNLGGFKFARIDFPNGDLRYGMGITCPDLDNDGDPDLFVTNVGRETLYRNDGGGKFTDVTAESGIEDDFWSCPAAWADLDGDGDLDLYLGNYALIDFANYKVCSIKGIVSYCHPDTLRSAPDRLYRNDGNFHFTEVTKAAGIVEPGKGGKALAVLPFDQDGDGKLDLYVANDADPNFLWRNAGGPGELKFEEEAGMWGCDVSGRGNSQSCMGSDLCDVDGDLDLDLFSVNFGKESSILYLRGPNGCYEDRTNASGLGAPSYLFTGFGARFFDYDRDADFDLMVVNGHIVDNVEQFDPTQTFKQVPHLFENQGAGTFTVIGPRASPFFTKQNVGRGLAVGDLDNDGDLDVVVQENDDRLAVLENVGAWPGRWIGFKLAGTKSPRDAIGALVTIECAGRKQIEPLIGSSSYLSWSDLRLYFGLGDVPDSAAVTATIQWPSGIRQVVKDLAPNRYHEIVEKKE